MIIFELLALVLFVLLLAYLAFFSPKFNRFMKKFFTVNPETTDGIAEKVRDIEVDKAAAKAAIAARESAIKAEAERLSKINVK